MNNEVNAAPPRVRLTERLNSAEYINSAEYPVKVLAITILGAIFVAFTWRGIMMFFSADDLMNTYWAWRLDPWRLVRAQLLIWLPVYRPLGGAIYRLFFSAFGFYPVPLYVFCWMLLALNAILGYQFFRSILGRALLSFTALSLTLVHGAFQDLYVSAGTIYDRLWFLFTVIGITLYARMRRRGVSFRIRDTVLIILICILSMDSKESGVVLPLLLGCYEVLFVRPRASGWKDWLGKIWPMYLMMAAICVAFVQLRVKRTPELVLTPAYTPHVRLGIWLGGIARYFSILTYQHIKFSALTAGIVISVLFILALSLRNRIMIFGWFFFVVTITPVALISIRPGYVLYVPNLGLGLFIVGFIGSFIRGEAVNILKSDVAGFVIVTTATTWFHVHNWPPAYDSHLSPQYRLVEQFRRDYPQLPRRTNLLFVSDAFRRDAYDLLFTLRLMYGDDTIMAFRLNAPPDQQPPPNNPVRYDHIFVNYGGYYQELDTRDPAASIRWHILKDYAVGREVDMSRRDHSAYVVSGVMDYDGLDLARWTEPQAKLKFDMYPVPATFTAKFWVPDFIAKTRAARMTIAVNGRAIGATALLRDGMNEVSFPVVASQITRDGFTFVDINVSDPWQDQNGIKYGVLLLKAGFTYR